MFQECLPTEGLFPLDRIYLEITNRCNMACVFCPYPHQTRQAGRMTVHLLKRIVDELVKKKIATTIEIRGYGEPLMHPEWSVICKYILDSGLRLNLTTNGVLLTAFNVDKIAALDIDDLIISLQTPDEASYQLRKARLPYEQYIQRIRDFLRRMGAGNQKMHIRLRFLNTVGTKSMSFPERVSVLNHKGDMIAKLNEWVNIIYDLTAANGDGEKVLQQLNKVDPLRPTRIYVTDTISLETYLCNDFWSYGINRKINYPTTVARCRSMTLDSTLIYWDGDVSFCCADYDGYLKIGSLQTSTMADILNSPQAVALARSFKKFNVKHPYCQNCLGGKTIGLSVIKAIASSLYRSGAGEYQEIFLNARSPNGKTHDHKSRENPDGVSVFNCQIAKFVDNKPSRITKRQTDENADNEPMN